MDPAPHMGDGCGAGFRSKPGCPELQFNLRRIGGFRPDRRSSNHISPSIQDHALTAGTATPALMRQSEMFWYQPSATFR